MSLKRCTFEVIIPSLCHGSITDEPPEDINEAPEDLKAAFQNHVCRNPVLFAKNLPLLQKMLSASQRKPF